LLKPPPGNGHASVEQVASEAKKYNVKRLILAHIGRPTIKAMDCGKHADFGEFGSEGDLYLISNRTISKRQDKTLRAGRMSSFSCIENTGY
jgi:ribonuclease BN (tRNA processing enzyme)